MWILSFVSVSFLCWLDEWYSNTDTVKNSLGQSLHVKKLSLSRVNSDSADIFNSDSSISDLFLKKPPGDAV